MCIRDSILLDDLDKDGDIELIASSSCLSSTIIYVWDLHGKYNKSTMHWPMFQYDPQHTGCYKCEKFRPKPKPKITKTVTGECNEPCPQECIDNNAQCKEINCEDECKGECVGDCTQFGVGSPNYYQCVTRCKSRCVNAKKYSCSYEAGGCSDNSDCATNEYCINEKCIKSISITNCEGSQPNCKLVYDYDINTRYAKGVKTKNLHWIKLLKDFFSIQQQFYNLLYCFYRV